MDCQNCNDLLLDLAYGELDEVRAAAVRKHADGCLDCKQALRRIHQGRSIAQRLRVEDAPPVSAALRAAMEAAASRAKEASAAVPPATEASAGDLREGATAATATRPARWFDHLGEMAMRRQVVMAAVFFLMISVGFVFYQSHPRPTDAQDDRAPDVVPAVEVADGPSHPAPGSASPGQPPAASTFVRARERDDRARAVSAPSVAPVAAPHAHAADRSAHAAGSAELQRSEEENLGLSNVTPPNAPAVLPALPERAGNLAPAQQVAVVPSQQGPSPGELPPTDSGNGAQAQATNAQANNAASASSWETARRAAEDAAHRHDGATAVAEARNAVARAPDNGIRAQMAQTLAPILHGIGRDQEADELLQQAHLPRAQASSAVAVSDPQSAAPSSVPRTMRRTTVSPRRASPSAGHASDAYAPPASPSAASSALGL